MNEVLQKVTDTLNQNQGSMTFAELRDSLTYQEQQYLPRVLAYGKQTGTIVQTVAWDNEAGSITHTVSIGGGA